MQKRLHGAGAWQMEAAAVLVLFDLCGDLEEGHDDRRGLGLRERGAVWCKVAVRKAWWRRYAAHASSNRRALARKVVAEVRSLRRSTLTALIAFSQFPRAQSRSS